jgi:hypothetical protein
MKQDLPQRRRYRKAAVLVEAKKKVFFLKKEAKTSIQ